MGKKKKGKRNGKGKAIGLTRDYFPDAVQAPPYIPLKYSRGFFVPDGAPKSFRDLTAFIDGGTYSGITPSAKEKILEDSRSSYIDKRIKRLDEVRA